MAVTKRIRFEILRRDNHACRYCGAAAPDTKLTIDHVLPIALGGKDEPENLVTACRDCNSGKGSTGPGEHLLADVSEDALRWSAARQRAIEKLQAQREDEIERLMPFADAWIAWDPERAYLPADAAASVKYWMADGLEISEIVEALNIALDNRYVKHRDVFRYMAGVCRNKIAEIDKLTMAELEAE